MRETVTVIVKIDVIREATLKKREAVTRALIAESLGVKGADVLVMPRQPK